MPLVKVEVIYDGEGDRREKATFERDVDELNIHDWLWYMVSQSEILKFDVKDIQVFTSDGKSYRTEP